MKLLYFSPMVKTVYVYLLMAVLLSGTIPAWGNGLGRVTSAGPSWNSFTNENGTGLYHEILYAIFSAQNIQVVHKYTNANRGVQMVRKGLADIYTCRNDTEGFKELMLSQYPMYEGKVYAIFKKTASRNGREVPASQTGPLSGAGGITRPVSLVQSSSFWRRIRGVPPWPRLFSAGGIFT